MVYNNTYPEIPYPKTSIYKYLLPTKPSDSVVPLWPEDDTLFIDALDGERITRAQLRDEALRVVSGLRALGITRGHTVCLWGLNSLEWVRAAFGCMAAGVAVSPANAAYESKEIAHQINDSASELIFVSPDNLPKLEAAFSSLSRALPNSRIILLSKSPIANKPYKTVYDLMAYPPAAAAEEFDGDLSTSTTAWLCYSSGTTGLPKGVMSTHHNVISQIQAMTIGYEDIRRGKDVALGILPFSHIYGLVMVFMQPMTKGVPLVVGPRYVEAPILAAIAKYRVTWASFVPPIILSLVNSTTAKDYDLSSLTGVLCGAAPLGATLTEDFERKYPHIKLAQAYGATELSPSVMAMHTKDAAGKRGSVGQIMPGFTCRLVKEDGTDAAIGERGELWAAGPCVMKGYHNNPKATAESVVDGKWYRTGDVLLTNDGVYFYVVDRVKELIKYKGFQVPPAELEALLLTHPDVFDSGVVGVYDESQATELPRAYIVPAPSVRDAVMASEAAKEQFAKGVSAWVAARVSNHKRIRGGIVIVDVVPKSPSGKIVRKILRERAKKEFAEQGAVVEAKL